MSSCQIPDVGKGRPIGQLVVDRASYRFEEKPDVISEVESLSDRADEPCRRCGENRHRGRPVLPLALAELIDVVASVFTKEAHDFQA